MREFFTINDFFRKEGFLKRDNEVVQVYKKHQDDRQLVMVARVPTNVTDLAE